jgi:signal transduction histidine kinase/DNA-binding LytR/AlgR family response regulator
MQDKLTIENLQIFLNTVLENIYESVWIVDRHYKIAWCNTRFSKNVEGLFGKYLTVNSHSLDIVANEKVKQFWAERYEACFGGKTIKELDTYPHHELIAQLRMIPVYENQEVIAALCFSVNVKKDKDKDLALFYSQKQMTSVQRKQAELLAKISHELRTPLNGVMGLVHILLHENPQPEQVESLKKILVTTENLANITQKALDYINIAENTFTLQEKSFSVRVLLQGIVQMNTHLAEEKNNTLQLDISPETPDSLFGDDMRVAQILEQLIINAIKYTQNGHIYLKVKPLPQEMHNLIFLEIAIQDSGTGIAPNKLTHIFDILYATQEFKPSEKMLGLPLVKNLLEKLGGNIKVESYLGKGSTFTCEIPLKIWDTPAEIVEINKPIVLDSLAGLRVLYVEDNMLNQRWTGKFLQNWHITIDFASNGRQAVEKVRNCAPEHFYHIILMDLQMPELDGFEATKIIRTMTQIPIIALTALTVNDAKKKAFEIGMNDYISKPFSPELLHQKLKEHTLYDYFVFSEKLHRKILAAFDAIVEFADGDLAYQQEMFELYKRFITDFAIQFEEYVKKQDLAKLKTLEHKSRPSIKLLNLNCLEKNLQEVIEVIEATENQALTYIDYIQNIQLVQKFCDLCLAHLHIYSPSVV